MIEYLLPIGSLIASAIAIFITIRKHAPELENIDADTISKLYDTIEKQEKRFEKQEAKYLKLEQEFESYKQAMSVQMGYLQAEAAKWRTWAEKLSKQLKDNNITPENF